MNSFSFENIANIDLKPHIGKSYSYSRFTEVLGIRRQSGSKRERQLEELREHIDFTTKGNKFIILENKGKEEREREFFTLKDFYNKGLEIDRYEILKLVIMNFLKEEMRGNTSDKWRVEYITTYDRLAVDLGLVNKLFYGARYKYVDIGRLVKIKPTVINILIKSIRKSYFRFIKRGLEELREEGFIEYDNGLWGHRETFISKGKENIHENKIYSDNLRTYKEWVKLSEEQEKYYRKAIEESRAELNSYKLAKDSKEKTFGNIVNDKMYAAYGIRHVGERAEIRLTDKSNYTFFEKLKEANRERDWLAKHFYERMKKSREEAFQVKEDGNKKDLEDYILLLELFIKKMRSNPREELKWVSRKIGEFLNSASGSTSSIETGEVEYRRV